MSFPQVSYGVLSCSLGDGEGGEQQINYELTDNFGPQQNTRSAMQSDAGIPFDNGASQAKGFLLSLIWAWWFNQDPDFSDPSIVEGKLFVLNLSDPNDRLLKVLDIE